MTKPKKINTEKLHLAMAQCLKDLEWVEKSPKHVVNMNTWLSETPSDKEICQVCFGGAALVHRYGVKPMKNDYVDPDNCGLSRAEARAVQAMDYVRRGWLDDAYADFCSTRDFRAKKLDKCIEIKDQLHDDFVPYVRGGEKFKAWLRKAIKALRKADI